MTMTVDELNLALAQQREVTASLQQEYDALTFALATERNKVGLLAEHNSMLMERVRELLPFETEINSLWTIVEGQNAVIAGLNARLQAEVCYEAV